MQRHVRVLVEGVDICFLVYFSMIHDYWVFVSHLIPAYLADFACRLIGKKPRWVHAAFVKLGNGV